MRTIRLPRFVIALLCTTLQVCLGTVYAWSFFQTMLVRQSGWTFTQTAWAFSITIFSLGVAAAWAGQALPKYGPRRLAVIGSSLFAAGYLIAGWALHLNSIPLFYLGYGVIGGAGIGLGYVTPVATVAKWFPDHKGLVTGIVVMGFGVGAFLLSKGLAPLLVLQAGQDLKLVFVWLGVIFACVLIPCSLLLSNPPEPEQPAIVRAARAPSAGSLEDSVWPYLKSRSFVILWIVFFFNIAAGISVISFQSELLQEVWGLSAPSLEPAVLAEYGATLIAVSSLCNGVGRLFWGTAVGPDRTRRGVPDPAGQPDGGLRHPDDRDQSLGVLGAGVLRAAVLRRRGSRPCRRSCWTSSARRRCRPFTAPS